MKRLRSVGLGFIAVSAISAVVAGSAFAGAPEFGRCQKVAGEQTGNKTVYHGGFENSACTIESSARSGKFEWFPGVVKSHFTTASKPGTKVLFETVNKKKIVCTGETSSGEYAGTKTEDDVVFRFTGCDFEERYGYHGHVTYEAFSEGAAEGEIQTDPTECELGVVAKGVTSAKNTLALSCAEEAEFMWMKWKVPAYGTPAEPELCIRGWWFLTTRANSMSSPMVNLQSKQSMGVQKYTKFVEGPLELLESTLTRGTSFEQMGLGLTATQTNEEALEANSVV